MSSQIVTYADPDKVSTLQTLTTNVATTITTQSVTAPVVQGDKIFVGGVQIINAPNIVFPTQ